MSIHLEPGRFYAGISLPFFVTHAMVQHKLESLGFTGISFHQREQSAALRVDPKKDPKYDDGWDEWVEADYNGPDTHLSFDRHWSWLLVVPKKTAPDVTPEAPSDGANGSGSGGLLGALGLFVMFLGLFVRR